ncbi:MAG: hypothetical protein MJZ64_03295 [Paludibacteraceae bacterium]|nr:hypothetical protein [Paludibacteraceae bacterium]
MTDEEFVQSVMNEIPRTQINWRIIWTIRLVAGAIGVLFLLLVTPPSVWALLTANYLTSGLVIAGVTLLICRLKEVI